MGVLVVGDFEGERVGWNVWSGIVGLRDVGDVGVLVGRLVGVSVGEVGALVGRLVRCVGCFVCEVGEVGCFVG